MKRVIKSSTSVESDFLGITKVGNEVSFDYRLADDLSNLDATIVDGADNIFNNLSPNTYYEITVATAATEGRPVAQLSPTLYVYKLKNGRWYIEFLAQGINGMRNAIARAHLQVMGEYKSPNNKFKYSDLDIAQQVFIEATKLAAEYHWG